MSTAPEVPHREEREPEMASTRLFWQIREGNLNEILEFDLALLSSRSATDEEGGTTSHEVDLRDLISALAQAQAELIEELRDKTTNPLHLAQNEQWLRDLMQWTVSA